MTLQERFRESALPAALVAVPYGLVLYVLVYASDRGPGLPFVAGLFCLPVAIASVAVIIDDPRGAKRTRRHAAIGAIVMAACILLSILIFHEGGICVALASPVLFPLAIGGAMLTGFVLRQVRGRSFPVAMVLLPLFGMPVDAYTAYTGRDEMVETSIVIDAPRSEIWRHTVELPDVRSGELRWTPSHDIVGVPRPVSAVIDGTGIGAVRHLHWGSLIHFDERITAWEPEKRLAWDFVFDANSIPFEVEGHVNVHGPYLTISGGEYRIDPLTAGRTRLTLVTHYWMATPLNDYCAWWGRVFLNDIHGIVLEVIRRRSEAAAHPA